MITSASVTNPHDRGLRVYPPISGYGVEKGVLEGESVFAAIRRHSIRRVRSVQIDEDSFLRRSAVYILREGRGRRRVVNEQVS